MKEESPKIDISDAADAKRMRWILDGHGYFLEEMGVCGYRPCDDNEQDGAREAIDRAMAED